MTKEEYILLYEKFEDNTCSDAEIEQLLSFEDNFAMFDSEWHVSMGDRESIRTKTLKRLKSNINKTRKEQSFNPKYLIGIAAAVLVFISVALIFFLPVKPKSQQISKVKKTQAILPGKNQAILKMVDGSKIVLNEIKTGSTLKYGNLSVTKTSNGEIIYVANATVSNDNSGGFNEITTPKGGQFSIILEDGSKVWLNASSSLKFPKKFGAQQRKVELTGEGYFEIARNVNKPFIVAANTSTIKVLGTHFNISNYPEDSFTRTTLLEGSVEVKAMGCKKMLVPNQEASYQNNSKSIELRNVANAKDAIAWKEGVFIFRDENIQHIMQKLSRWYDVEVVFDKEALNEEFSGSISRYQNIDKVLKQLELTGTLKFKIQERRIYVMK